MPWPVSLMFAVLSVLWFGIAALTGSGWALAYGMADAAIGLVAFCIWAWSL